MRNLYPFAAGILLASTLSFAQVPTPTSPLASCGDEKVKFEISGGPTSTQAAPDPTKATIYIIQAADLDEKSGLGEPLVRHAIDGAWIGATQGLMYVRASVAPGTHYLCSRWQSDFARRSDQVSLNNFDAVPGKTYYFRLQIWYEASPQGGGASTIDLQPVSEDEGILLVSKATQSISKPKS